MTALQEQAHAARELIEALRQAGRDDDETVDISIASETDLREVVSWALGKIDENAALRDAATDMAQKCRARAARFDGRVERMVDAVRDALEIAGLKKLELPEATLSVRVSPPAVVVIEAERIPGQYFETRTETKLNKAKLRQDLLAGTSVDGATLENIRNTLSIRRA